MSALDRLADLVGIAPRYHDIWGQEHLVPPDTKAALLIAMGFGIESDARIDEQIRRLEDDGWSRALPPAHVLAADMPGTIALVLPPIVATLSWTITPEQSLPIRGATPWQSLALIDARDHGGHRLERRALPLEPLAAGYYRLSILADGVIASTTLIVTPERCWLPLRLRAVSDSPDGGGRVWGLAAQLYGLRSARNWGIGDFTDLAELTRTAAALGADAIGLNPLHALFGEAPERFGPYAPSSRQFLNPLYLDVEKVDGFSASQETRARVAEPAFQHRLAELRQSDLVDYPGVAAVKRPVLEILFKQFQRTPNDVDFERFRMRLGQALDHYAIFEALSEHFATGPDAKHSWSEWPEPYRDPASPAVAAFAAQHADRVTFFAWLQWQADRQLAEVQALAQAGGMAIGLYRDLAVGSDRAGAETWLDPVCTARGASVGAPPDAYNPNGQDWGLPPLDPIQLQRDAYRSFITLVRTNMRHAGALRIDHAFGLMRLFWIPTGRKPTEGAYVGYPLATLLAILKLESHRNRCLVIGEDLGTVPPGFREALAEAGVLSYRLLYFERGAEDRFLPPEDYPALALAAASTHDLPTLVGWWQESDIDLRAELDLYPSGSLLEHDRGARAADRRRLLEALAAQRLLDDPAEDAVPLIAVHRFLARSRAALLMIQLEDVLGVREQANLPGTTDQHPNWRRKLPVALDAFLAPDGPLAKLAAAVTAERPKPSATAGRLARPAATYRVQLHKDFDFAQAAAIVPCLAALGITHLYCSPYLKARPGSRHGYDITDHARFNPELGGAAGFETLVSALDRHGMGHILDFVPNHMGINGADNFWWLDVLEWGEASPFADYFDIDWRPRFGTGGRKLLLPILGGHYGQVLESGELHLRFDDAAGSFSAWYAEHRLPICPIDYPLILDIALAVLAERAPDAQETVELMSLIGDFRALGACRMDHRRSRIDDGPKLRLASLTDRSPALRAAIDDALTLINGRPGQPDSFGSLHELLAAQSYRVAFWRVAGEINYRRFFDINDLAGLRIENRELFDRAHRLVFELIDSGRLQGLRIDHIDGLADPAEYCRRIQARVGPDLYLVIEKILAQHERLRVDWPISGTTGYEILNQINGVFVDAAGERGLDRLYRRFTGIAESFDDLLYGAKTQILENNLSSELEVLALELKRIADGDRRTCDYTFDALRRVLIETIAWFPVYRTYVTAQEIAPEDRQYIDWAINRAIKRSGLADLTIYDFLRTVLTLEHCPTEQADAVLTFVRKFQQLTGPVMAKGLEDTSFYRFNRLVSLNEVGGDPRRFGISAAAFHHLNEQRLAVWPHQLVATATHDTKRGEDMRARLNLLSEMPAAWGSRVTRWGRINRLKRHLVDDLPAPSRNDEYLIYQTLLGSWPLALKDKVEPGSALDDYVDRVTAYIIKAMREAKLRTSWTQPNAAYEAAVTDFIRRLLDARRPNLFLADFMPFQQRLAGLGMVNGLSQMVLKLTIPGVPDIYQGTEFWDLSLVDPDNRRPVDYAARARGLASNEPVEALLAAWPDGRIKQRLLACLLRHRAAHRDLYARGTYDPLTPLGARSDNLLAFQRRSGELAVTILVPILSARLLDSETAPIGPALWQDTALDFPTPRRLRDLFTGETLEAQDHDGVYRLPVGAALSRLPVACLVSNGG